MSQLHNYLPVICPTLYRPTLLGISTQCSASFVVSLLEQQLRGVVDVIHVGRIQFVGNEVQRHFLC